MLLFDYFLELRNPPPKNQNYCIQIVLYIWCLLCFSFISAEAQQLEFNAQSATASNGPTTASGTMTYRSNTGTSSTFNVFTPTVTLNLAVSNQQYTSAANPGITFGADRLFNNTSTLQGIPRYNDLTTFGNGSDGLFTSISTGPSATMDADVNYAFEMFVDAYYQIGQPLSARNYYGDITFTFNRPVLNPILHFSGMGGAYLYEDGDDDKMIHGYFTEFELINSELTITRLTGDVHFIVNNNRNILNSNTTMPENYTESDYSNVSVYASGGSIRVNSGGTPITSVSFRVYLKGVNAWRESSSIPFAWAGHIDAGRPGDGLMISSSLEINRVLPLELLSFTGGAHREGNKLEWTVAQVRDFSTFEIEHCIDQVSWASLGSVHYQREINSLISGSENFQYIDRNPAMRQDNYYRLKLIDGDRSIQYSSIIRISPSAPKSLAVYPNPSDDFIQLEWQVDRPSVVSVFNAAGMEVKRYTINKGSIHGLSVKDLAQGVYTLKVSDHHSAQPYLRFVKK
jgi:hypothetical protein